LACFLLPDWRGLCGVVIARLGVFFVAGLAWFVWCCDSQAWRVFVVAGLAWFVLVVMARLGVLGAVAVVV
jgi:hypothetical protein